MSDSFITLVPENVDKHHANELIDKIINHLSDEGIIQNELTDCVLANKGYQPGDNVRSAIDGNDFGFQDLRTNGLEFTNAREVFHNESNGLDRITCPECQTNIIDTDWGQALEEWTNETGNDKVTCPNCNSVNSITEYRFQPSWGFGNMALTFWNWPNLKDEFVNDLEALIERKIKIIYGRL